jgi:hypothetical protein
MLRHAGFGATGPQIDALVNQDWSAYLDQALDLDPDTDPGAVATPRPKPVSPAPPDHGAGEAALEQFTSTLFDQMTDLTSRWVRRMAAVQEPVHEKLTLLWHRRGDAVLAGRRSQQRRRGERESVPRVHGALHARPRKRLHTTDFRDIYHELLSKSLCTDAEPVVGTDRRELGFL